MSNIAISPRALGNFLASRFIILQVSAVGPYKSFEEVKEDIARYADIYENKSRHFPKVQDPTIDPYVDSLSDLDFEEFEEGFLKELRAFLKIP